MKSFESILRSLFISIFPFTALLILAYGIMQYYKQIFSWGILGMLTISAVIVVFFAGLFIKPRARTDANLKLYSSILIVGIFSSLIEIITSIHLIFLNLFFSLVLGIGWILYLKWYSIFKDRKNETLKTGKKLTEFKLENSNKEQVLSSSFLGNPSIFIFYRGNWCPLCMAQIKEVAAQYEALNELGVNTIFISPQPHKQTKKLADKFKLNFHFLVDYKNKVAKQLNILSEKGIPAGFQVLNYDSDTVMPTVVITDKNGEIIFADLTNNYRVRPEPALFLKIIKESVFL